jgi:DNA phosphorothioation-dependent restriction protein DptH
MSLYIQTLASYIKEELDKTTSDVNYLNESRFIVQSLPPREVFELFKVLEGYQLEKSKVHSIKGYYKVASGLWLEWLNKRSETEINDMKSHYVTASIQDSGSWIDFDDRLTWYRNRTLVDENVDKLVVVLVGLNHATDQGGLSDFHVVDEDKIWRKMGRSFIPWINDTATVLGLEEEFSESNAQVLDSILTELFNLRPLQLRKLAQFINEITSHDKIYSFADFLEIFFRKLPYWGIPPILADEFHEGTISKKEAEYIIKTADQFISHRGYKTLNNQKKDWAKIEIALKDDDFEIPKSLKNDYKNIEEYRDILFEYIFKGDTKAREMLLQTDIYSLLQILKKKETKEPSEKKSQTKLFNKTSYESFTHALMEAVSDFVLNNRVNNLDSKLTGIHIEVIRFDHDIVEDEDGENGKHELAKELLNGCLNGMEYFLGGIDIRMPVDEEQLLKDYADWEIHVPITFNLNLDDIHVGTSRAKPNVQFKLVLGNEDPDSIIETLYRWSLNSTVPERVMYESAKHILEQWKTLKILPAFKIPEVSMAALYYAADDDEANRLVSQSICDMSVCDLTEGLELSDFDPSLIEGVKNLSNNYFQWLTSYVNDGFYNASIEKLIKVLSSYEDLAKKTLDKSLVGSELLLKRLYKAFFVISDKSNPNDSFISSALAWGLSPSVLELLNAHHRYLSDGIPEIFQSLILEKDHKSELNRLIELSQIHRPVAALVSDHRGKLSSEIRSFGMLHYIGSPPTNIKSLAVQTLLRESNVEDDDSINEVTKTCPEKAIVSRVLDDYQSLNPHASDGIRILAVNVNELEVILAGIDLFLSHYLINASSEWPRFSCSIMVYSTSASPLAIESKLSSWREYVEERHQDKGRQVNISVAHKFTSLNKLKDIIKKEEKLFDIAFIFHFLKEGLIGKADATMPFEYEYDSCSYFPISEYPRPIKNSAKGQRQSLISNRQLRVQTRHADMSARLIFSGHDSDEYLIYGEVDYEPWEPIVKELHNRCCWLACVDPFIDKELLNTMDEGSRKIVGFMSGLGAYGELNLTISTEKDTLDFLSSRVISQLNQLLPLEPNGRLNNVALKVVAEAENVIGLSSIRASLGAGQKIREVLGFAAINKIIDKPCGHMSQLLPLDSFQHWFTHSEFTLRPDLLQLTLEIRSDDLPLIHASVIECKLANLNPVHIAKAMEQVQEGLNHLTRIFAPKSQKSRSTSFDRKYWWAQLHRAITARTVVNISESEWLQLDRALENLTEGLYEIKWHGAIFTFWTNVEEVKEPQAYLINHDQIDDGYSIESGFSIEHHEMSCKKILTIFENEEIDIIQVNSGPSIVMKADLRPNGNEFDERYDTNEKTNITSVTDVIEVIDMSVPTSVSEESDVPAVKDVTEASDVPEVSNINTTECDKKQASKESLVLSFRVPEKIFLGTRKNNTPVYWHFGHPQLPNRHLLIFGGSGNGKTYGIQCFLSEFAKQGLNSLIIDYTDGFLPAQVEDSFAEVSKLKNHFVVTEKLPLNPFRRQTQTIDPSMDPIEETSYQVATRIESIFSSIFNLGDQQSAALIRVLQAGLENSKSFTFEKVLDGLREDSSNGATLANKLEPLIRAQPFRNSEGSEQAWDEMLTSRENYVHVMQLKGLAREIQKMVTEFTLWDLWDYAQNTGSKNRPIPIVLDEIQNLDHSNDSPIDKMLREGRKFGLSMILATQTTSQFNQEQKDRLFQAGHKLFFKPATTETDKFAQILSQSASGTKSEWAQRLGKMEKGQCYSLGPVIKSDGSFKEEAILVSITPLEKRGGE